MVVCLGQGADLHTAQLMPLPLTRVVRKKIQEGHKTVVCVCVCVCVDVSGGMCFENRYGDWPLVTNDCPYHSSHFISHLTLSNLFHPNVVCCDWMLQPWELGHFTAHGRVKVNALMKAYQSQAEN